MSGRSCTLYRMTGIYEAGNYLPRRTAWPMPIYIRNEKDYPAIACLTIPWSSCF
jgi:hypothetical protein